MSGADLTETQTLHYRTPKAYASGCCSDPFRTLRYDEAQARVNACRKVDLYSCDESPTIIVSRIWPRTRGRECLGPADALGIQGSRVLGLKFLNNDDRVGPSGGGDIATKID